MNDRRWWLALALLPVAAFAYGAFIVGDGLQEAGVGAAVYYLAVSGVIGVIYALLIGALARRLRVAEAAPLLDPVTGLPTTTLLVDRLQQSILAGQRHGSHVPLILMSLDRFSAVNAALGRDEGDAVLAQLSRRLLGTLRESDTLARLSGDEFAILLPSARDVEAAAVIVGKIRSALEKPFTVGNVPVELSASFGIALAPDHGGDAHTLIKNAAAASRAAKDIGSRIEVFAPGKHDLSPDTIAVAAELRRAIEEKQLVLFYQPKTSMKGGGVEGVEALVRWVHPVRGMVMPNDFIPLAEQTDLMKPLTMYVLDEALKQVGQWRARGLELKVSVNISARNLSDLSFPHDVRGVLRSNNAHPTWLDLEVTESTVINDRARAVLVLQELSDMGVRIAIDDYGAGYTSLSYLTRLPIHALKIDKSFIQNMLEEQHDGLIVKSTIELGRGLGLEVIAEGVETEKVWNRLVDLGCDSAQGYYVSRPMPADELVLD